MGNTKIDMTIMDPLVLPSLPLVKGIGHNIQGSRRSVPLHLAWRGAIDLWVILAKQSFCRTQILPVATTIKSYDSSFVRSFS
jgi:hypothetical protein